MRNDFYSEFDWERQDATPPKADDFRSPFQVDRDRIIHTSAFRRLQSKTQVFMSGEYDFYRTRLTHSIEVAQIGRSICSRLQAVSEELEVLKEHLEALHAQLAVVEQAANKQNGIKRG